MKHARLQRLRPPEALVSRGLVEPGDRLCLPLSPAEAFDPQATFDGGQLFRWRRAGGRWVGALGGSALAVQQVAEGLQVEVAGAPRPAVEIWRFLGLDWPLQEIERRLSGDRWLREAWATLPGLRLLRQDPWECAASFVCAQWSSVAKISTTLGRVAERYGRSVSLRDGVKVRLFPRPAALARLTEADLRACGLGYRARYLLGTARAVAEGTVDLSSLRGAPYELALQEALRLPGVGRKVADCILLFCLDQSRACPVDVWVRRAFRECYPRALQRYLPDLEARGQGELSAVEHRALVRFAWDRWGELAGWAQQYLFHARRAAGRRAEIK